jgi:formate dehydrogenase beta subunit
MPASPTTPDEKRGSGRGFRRPVAHPKGRQVEPGALAEIRELLGDASRRRDLLIEHLHRIQDRHGHIAARHLAALAEDMRLSQAEVYEVATFYAHFNVVKEGEPLPPPLTLRVCDGIACKMSGAGALIEDVAKALGSQARVVAAPCVGACDKAPVAVVGQRQVTAASTESVKAAVVNGETTYDMPPYRDLDAYWADDGYEVLRQCLDGTRSRDDVIAAIDESGLRGLGGAGFPVARKWRFLLNAPKPRTVIINADEGEPGTFKDRHCFETDPHRVLEGTLIAAWAVEAEAAYIYLRDEYPQVNEILRTEIAGIEAAGLTGGVELHLRRGAGAYVCGEESALMESIEGKRGLPRNRPPYPAQAGLFGRPTLINNVESVYWLRDIVEKGAQWFVEAGRPRFYSVSGRVKEPGVKRAPSGITIRRLIDEYCGGMADGHTLEAYLPGGASGGILPASMADLPLDFGTLEKYGCFLGSAAVIILSDRDDIRETVIDLMRFFEDESCGQCTPCRVGTEKMLKLIERPQWDEGLLGELAGAMVDASICGLGQAAPNPVMTAMRFFPEEVK